MTEFKLKDSNIFIFLVGGSVYQMYTANNTEEELIEFFNNIAEHNVFRVPYINSKDQLCVAVIPQKTFSHVTIEVK